MTPRRRTAAALLLAAIIASACGARAPEPADPPASPAATSPAAAIAEPTAAPGPGSATAAPATVPQAAPQPPAPAGAHPRLWLTPATVAQLRGWATPSNPAYAEGLAPLAERARADMDSGLVPGQDCGQRGYSEYPTEAYAELFAFMSLVGPDTAARADDAARARALLMHALDAAAQGPAAAQDYACPGDDSGPVYYPPFRDPAFFTEDSDRPRWHGEAFALTVDWIYPSLTAADKATVRAVFTRWGREIIERGYHHPEPAGLTRDPRLLADRAQVRWAGNNYFTAHMRNLGLMAMALDPADSSPELQGYLDDATGAWLYIFDELTRTDARGGLLPEGFEYSPQTASYAIQLMLALRSSGEDSAALRGPHVDLQASPFWDDFVAAYLHSLSPAPADDEGVPIYQAAWYGDAQRYRLPDFIDAFGALAAHDRLAGNARRLEALRWIQINTAPGGPAGLIGRVRGADSFRSSILYFMLLDPGAPPPADPRAAMPTGFVAAGPQRLFSRTGWGPGAAWLTFALPWNAIDHQHADGNSFELYRGGEWLTKTRVGYANIAEGIASSEFRNSVAVQNARPPDRDDTDWRVDLWRRGSQWNLVASGDPGPLRSSFGAGYTYAAGDATRLYNSASEGATEVQHASRELVWIQPDIVVVYDRAAAPAGRFKRFWLQLPRPAAVSGRRAAMTTARGQQLFVTALLPEGSRLRMADPAEENIGETVASGEPMTQRLVAEAPDSADVRFLHVLQGASAGAAPAEAAVLRSDGGAAYDGAAVAGVAVLFPHDAGGDVAELSYAAPAGTRTHIIAGLAPGGAYTAELADEGGAVRVRVRAGGDLRADGAGVLVVGSPLRAASVFLPLLRGERVRAW